MSVLTFESSSALLLNITLLFCVVLEPFLYYVLETAPSSFLDSWSIAFALDMGVIMGLLSGMMYLAVRQVKHSDASKLVASSIRRFKTLMISQAIVSALFFASISNIFWVPVPIAAYLRFLLWYISSWNSPSE